jgi:hypothetical protein
MVLARGRFRYDGVVSFQRSIKPKKGYQTYHLFGITETMIHERFISSDIITYCDVLREKVLIFIIYTGLVLMISG